MNLFTFLVLLGVTLMNVGGPQSAQKKYVCTPCGISCDKAVHDRPGTCSSCGMALVDQATVKFTNISAEDLCKRVTANPKAVLLDVRSPGEFKGSSLMRSTFGHFKNAININIDELESRVGELSQYKDQEVIVYCSHSQRSPRASFILNNHGFTNVKNMSGGVSTLENKQSGCLKNIFVVH